MRVIRRLWKDEEAATAVEYGLLVALIAAVVVGTVQTLGTRVNSAFNTVANAIGGGGGGGFP